MHYWRSKKRLPKSLTKGDLVKKIIAAFAAIVLSMLGLVIGASPAEAHTSSVKATCEALTVDLNSYKYQAATEAEYKYTRYSYNPKHDGADDPRDTGSTPLNDHGHWQSNTHNYNGTDPIGEVFFQGGGNNGDNGSYFYWTKEKIKDATPEKINHVKVVINGEVKVDADFKYNYSGSWNFDQNNTTNAWSVVVTAWDDSRYNVNKSGSENQCVKPTPTPTPSDTPTETPTPTVTPSPSDTPTPTPSETPTVTPTPTPSETDTPTPSPTPTEPTVTPTPSDTPTPTVTPTPTDTPTASPSPSVTPSKTPKPSATPTPEHLAYTGSDVDGPLGVGIGIIILGTAMLALRRFTK